MDNTSATALYIIVFQTRHFVIIIQIVQRMTMKLTAKKYVQKERICAMTGKHAMVKVRNVTTYRNVAIIQMNLTVTLVMLRKLKMIYLYQQVPWSQSYLYSAMKVLDSARQHRQVPKQQQQLQLLLLLLLLFRLQQVLQPQQQPRQPQSQ